MVFNKRRHMRGERGVSQKVTKSDGGKGVGLFIIPKVTSLTVGHFWEGGGRLTQKVTKNDVEGGSAYLVSQK